MSILYDYSIFLMQKYGGISRYFYNLVKNLKDKNQIEIFAPLFRNNYIKDLPPHVINGKYYKKLPPKTNSILKYYSNFLTNRYIQKKDFDIVHHTYFFNKNIKNKSHKTVVTVYDMIHELFQDKGLKNDPTPKLKKVAVMNSDHIICISNSTKRDLLNFYNIDERKVSVIHLGFELENDNKSSKIKNNGIPFLLYVGERFEYKNFENMIIAFSSSKLLKENFNIISFGGPPFSAKEKDLFKKNNLHNKKITHISGDDKVLSSLYNTASAYVMPSLYEGFGIPLLEAMGHNCPVICSNISSIPEVVGNAGEFFDPNSNEDIKNSLEKVLLDKDLQKKLIENGKKRLKLFDWKKCAQETNKVYQSII